MSTAKDAAVCDDSVVSIHYIICECGETFPTESDLRDHLEKEHPHKKERKEFKCGVCGSVFPDETDCISHYEETHMETAFEEENEEPEEREEKEEKPSLEDEVYPHYDVETGDVIEEVEIKPDVADNGVQYMICEDGQQYIVTMTDEQYIQYCKQAENGEQQIEEQEVVASQETSQDMSQDISEDSSQDISQDISEDTSLDETARAAQVLVKAENISKTTNAIYMHTKKPEIKPPALKMVRDPDTGSLVLVFNRTPATKPRSRDGFKKKHVSNQKHIVCETCGKSYASQAALKYHQRVHTGDKPYQCHLCPKAFTMPLFLQIHVRTHTGEKPYQCPECPKAFSNKAALLRHERVHTGEKPYVCPMCLKTFTQSNSMKLHVATVHLKQPAPYKSRSRREREQARGQRHHYKFPPQIKTEKIKAFAPQASKRRPSSASRETAHHDTADPEVQNETLPEDEVDCYEIVYEEEVH